MNFNNFTRYCIFLDHWAYKYTLCLATLIATTTTCGSSLRMVSRQCHFITYLSTGGLLLYLYPNWDSWQHENRSKRHPQVTLHLVSSIWSLDDQLSACLVSLREGSSILNHSIGSFVKSFTINQYALLRKGSPENHHSSINIPRCNIVGD